MGRLNKPAIPGYEYRAPNRTNANDLTPNLREDYDASQDADIDRIRRGLKQETRREGEQGYRDRARTQEAAGRAVSRTLGRAGLMQGAFAVGTKLGEEIDKRNPKIGEAINKVIDKIAVPSDRVKLTKEAQERVDQEKAFKDVEDSMRRVRNNEDRGYKKGGKVSSASKRADGIAQRGKTRGFMR